MARSWGEIHLLWCPQWAITLLWLPWQVAEGTKSAAREPRVHLWLLFPWQVLGTIRDSAELQWQWHGKIVYRICVVRLRDTPTGAHRTQKWWCKIWCLEGTSQGWMYDWAERVGDPEPGEWRKNVIQAKAGVEPLALQTGLSLVEIASQTS